MVFFGDRAVFIAAAVGDGQAARRPVAARGARRRVCHRAFSDFSREKQTATTVDPRSADVFGALFLGVTETRAAFVGSVGIVRRFPSDREEDDA
jgi:hypothetical protein